MLPCHCLFRSLKVLSLEDSEVTDNSGEWMHALAQYNSVLEVLNFAVLGLEAIDISDLTILVQKCKSLVSLKVGEIDMEELIGVLSKVPNLKELGAGSCNELRDDEEGAVPISLPAHLTALTGLWAMNDSGWRMVLPVAANLRKLELKFTLLSRNAHCELLSHCHVLEELQVVCTWSCRMAFLHYCECMHFLYASIVKVPLCCQLFVVMSFPADLYY